MQEIISRLSERAKTAEVQRVQPCASCTRYAQFLTRCLQVAYKENYINTPEMKVSGVSLCLYFINCFKFDF